MSQISQKENKPIYEQKCPYCGGSLVYDVALGKRRCEYCDSVIENEAAAEPQQTQKPSIQVTREERDHVLETMPPLPVYCCQSCGAEVLAAPQSGALTCPYCKNNIVLTNQFSGAIKPDGIIPFKITPDNLPAAVRKFYTGNPFVPKKMFSKANIGPVTGMYVPFWLFDCDVSGDVSFTGSKRGKTYSTKDYMVTEIEHYRMDRGVIMSFKDLAIDASRKMEDKLMDSIQPFRMEDLRPFDVAYLAGYTADRFDQTSQESRSRNDIRVSNTAMAMAQSKGVSSSFYGVGGASRHLVANLKNTRYVLLPVYNLDVEYEGKTYHYAVNGQTGQVTGELPDTKEGEKRFYRYNFWAGFGGVAALITLLILIFG